MHRLSRINCLSKVQFKRYENLTEFREAQPAIMIFVIALKEQINFILGRNNSELLHKSVEQFLLSNTAPPHGVKHSENVEHVEVNVLD